MHRDYKIYNHFYWHPSKPWQISRLHSCFPTLEILHKLYKIPNLWGRMLISSIYTGKNNVYRNKFFRRETFTSFNHLGKSCIHHVWNISVWQCLNQIIYSDRMASIYWSVVCFLKENWRLIHCPNKEESSATKVSARMQKAKPGSAYWCAILKETLLKEFNKIDVRWQ